MKKVILLFIFALALAFTSKAQQGNVLHFENGYTYKIKLTGVDNFLRAKEISYSLEEKFKFFPHFNDVTDCFEFYSNLNISKEEVIANLKDKGYKVELFENKACAPCEIKEQEQ